MNLYCENTPKQLTEKIIPQAVKLRLQMIMLHKRNYKGGLDCLMYYQY